MIAYGTPWLWRNESYVLIVAYSESGVFQDKSIGLSLSLYYSDVPNVRVIGQSIDRIFENEVGMDTDGLKTLNVSLYKTMHHTITYTDHTFSEVVRFPELPTPKDVHVREVSVEGNGGRIPRCAISSRTEVKRLKQQSPLYETGLVPRSDDNGCP